MKIDTLMTGSKIQGEINMIKLNISKISSLISQDKENKNTISLSISDSSNSYNQFMLNGKYGSEDLVLIRDFLNVLLNKYEKDLQNKEREFEDL